MNYNYYKRSKTQRAFDIEEEMVSATSYLVLLAGLACVAHGSPVKCVHREVYKPLHYNNYVQPEVVLVWIRPLFPTGRVWWRV